MATRLLPPLPLVCLESSLALELNALPSTLAGEVLKDPSGHLALETWVLPGS